MHDSFFIGDKETYLDSFPACKDETPFFGLFVSLLSVNKFFEQYNTNFESLCNINEIHDNVFSNYEALRAQKYKLGGVSKNFGVGKSYNFSKSDKVSLISYEDVMMDDGPNFNINHPVKKLAKDFSKIFEYDSGKGFCGFKDFNFNDYLSDFNSDNFFKVNLVGMFGHIHLDKDNQLDLNKNEPINLEKDNKLYLNKDNPITLTKSSELFLKKDFFIEDPELISSFISTFRIFNQNNLMSGYESGFDYSNLVINRGKKYYFYSEATGLGINYEVGGESRNHHDRLGFILELVPDKKGVSNSVISLASYVESINALLKFKSKKDNYNSKLFINELSDNLESVLK